MSTKWHLLSMLAMCVLISSPALAQTSRSRISENQDQIEEDTLFLADELKDLEETFQSNLPPRERLDMVAQVRLTRDKLIDFRHAMSNASEANALTAFYDLDAELHRLLAVTLSNTEGLRIEAALLGVIDADDLLHDSVLQVNDTPEPPTLRDEIIDLCYALELHSLRLSDNIRDTVGLGADTKPLKAAARQLVFETAEFQDAASDGASRASLQRMFNRIDQDLYGLINQLSYSDYTPRFTNQLDQIQDIHEQLGRLLYAEADASDIYVEER